MNGAYQPRSWYHRCLYDLSFVNGKCLRVLASRLFKCRYYLRLFRQTRLHVRQHSSSACQSDLLCQ